MSVLLFTSCKGSNNSIEPARQNAKTSKNGTVREALPNGIVIQIKKAVELRDDRSNYQAFKENLNTYEAKIIIPEAAFTSDLEIVRSNNVSAVNPYYESISKTSAEYVSGQYVITDTLNLWRHDLNSKTLTYKIYSGEAISGEVTATLAPDLLITRSEKPITLQSLGISSGEYNFGVIFLEEGSVLQTEGLVVKLNADRLFSENAMIETFSEEFAQAVPIQGRVGLPGGELKMNMVRAMGNLSVYMRGTHGGKGRDAEVQTNIGAKGAKGADGENHEKCHYSKEAPLGEICSIVCDKNPGSGGQGAQGPKGNQGGVGMVGGASGIAEVIVEEKVGFFDVRLTQQAGKGGQGGNGSVGGTGGAGGDAGKVVERCSKDVRAGTQGPQGPQGDQGPEGADGVLEESSVIIAGKKLL